MLRIGSSEDLPNCAVLSRRIHALQHDEQRSLLFRGQAGEQLIYLLSAGFQVLPGALLVPANFRTVGRDRAQAHPAVRPHTVLLPPFDNANSSPISSLHAGDATRRGLPLKIRSCQVSSDMIG